MVLTAFAIVWFIDFAVNGRDLVSFLLYWIIGLSFAIAFGGIDNGL